ncbi:hypothetical protein SLEP1_g34442 [Rubroshorea leprosula]|uniref:Uncharacterized protein n=1 Tax=Rubroshorea leprosula TaxID=152421 RepID=A0AAV5KK70_9ROSI|nr:hypothetical protein SLEP1_g34442 [Rubroshorea leprosula]
MTVAKRFINSTFPEVDRRGAREEIYFDCWGVVGCKLVNALSQEFFETLRERNALAKEKEKLGKKKDEVEKDLAEVMPELRPQEKKIEGMKKAIVELKKNVNLLVHNAMKEHIVRFLKSSTFDNIVNLYRLSTAILAFSDCRKKVKPQHPELDVTDITFGEQERGVEEDGEKHESLLSP